MGFQDFVAQGLMAIYESVQSLHAWIYVVTGLSGAAFVVSVLNLFLKKK